MKLAKITKKGIKTRLLILGIIIAAYFNVNMYFNYEINREIGKLKKEGQITTLQEMKKEFVRKDNRASLYTGAGELVSCKLSIPGDSDIMVFYEEHKEGIKEELEKNMIVFDIMDRVSTKGNCDFKMDTEKGFAMLVPNYLHLRSVAQLLEMKATDAIAEGNYEEAVKRCSQCLTLGKDIGQEKGVLINHMISIAIINIGTAPLDYMVKNNIKANYAPVSEELNIIRTTWNEHFIKSLEGERTFGVDFYSKISSSDKHINNVYCDEIKPLENWHTRTVIKPYVMADELYYIKYMNNLIEQVKRNPAGDINQPELSKYYIFSRIIIPSIKRAAEQNRKIVNRCNEVFEGINRI